MSDVDEKWISVFLSYCCLIEPEDELYDTVEKVNKLLPTEALLNDTATETVFPNKYLPVIENLCFNFMYDIIKI